MKENYRLGGGATRFAKIKDFQRLEVVSNGNI